VIEFDRHIEILLLSHDCVIVPGLGGFVTNHVDAYYDERDCMFLPPSRTLGFNPQLTMNDSLLVQSYVEAYDISYPEALRTIEDEVRELRQHLEIEGAYDLGNLGSLELNEYGKYIFSPCEAGIMTPIYYGLGAFEIATVTIGDEQETADATVAGSAAVSVPTVPQKAQEVIKASDAPKAEGFTEFPEDEEVAAEPKAIGTIYDTSDVIVIKMSWIRNTVAVAAACIAFFMLTTPISNSRISETPLTQVNSASLLSMSATKPVAKPASPAATPLDAVAAAAAETLDTVAATADSTAPQASADSVKTAVADTKATATDALKPATAASAAPAGDVFRIVLASQISRKNAETLVEQLHKAGYTDAELYIRNNITRVTLGQYATSGEAYNRLNSLRKKEPKYQDAWVLKTQAES